MELSHSDLEERRAGILLHPTSLPGGPGNGDIGPEAYRFVDFLIRCGATVWQMLPLGPTHEEGSPYHSLSAHAGNPLLISAEHLAEEGWLTLDEEAEDAADAHTLRWQRLRRAYAALDDHAEAAKAAFVREQADWLEDFVLFMALRHDYGGAWWEWPEPLRDRDKEALAAERQRLAREMDFHRFVQWQFFRQWTALKAYANARAIRLFGDMPIFVAHDSAEVWANRRYFALDTTGQPESVAGVPPDYFSETGQYWGNPHYRWDRLAEDGYGWWIDRLRTQLQLFDWIRIDHFRGFRAFWAIPSGAEAVDGHWCAGPGEDFFYQVRQALGSLPLVAEDLGVITPEVTELREAFGLPGMKVLQFAFSGDPVNPFLPHYHRPGYVVYTGTHDNNTVCGWWMEELDDGLREWILDYLGWPAEVMPWPLVRAALASVANTAVIPLQDLMGLGSEARMNTPATTEGNWAWRFHWDEVPEGRAEAFRHLLALYGRLVA